MARGRNSIAYLDVEIRLNVGMFRAQRIPISFENDRLLTATILYPQNGALTAENIYSWNVYPEILTK